MKATIIYHDADDFGNTKRLLVELTTQTWSEVWTYVMRDIIGAPDLDRAGALQLMEEWGDDLMDISIHAVIAGHHEKNIELVDGAD